MRLKPPDSPSVISSKLDEAIGDARQAHGAHFDALKDSLDATILRLEVLRIALAEIVEGRAEASKFVELQLIGGDKPRLWIDLVSYVVMAPTPRHYQFIRDRQDCREVLFEADNHDEMVDAVTRYLADRIVVRERQLLGEKLGVSELSFKTAPKYSTLALVFVWFCGVILGLVGLLTFGIWYGGP